MRSPTVWPQKRLLITCLQDLTREGSMFVLTRLIPSGPGSCYIDSQDQADAENYADYEFDELTLNQSAVLDINKTAKLNLKIPYLLGQKQGGYIKIGGKVRMKSKERNNEAQVYNRYPEPRSIYSQIRLH